jgi:pimeloyl-ACP methyl ester carboxylesterase
MHAKTMSRSSAVGLALAAMVAVIPPAEAASAPEWTVCTGDDVPEDMECATIEVPVDWSRPGGRKVALGVARLPATDPARRVGSVLIAPGGPGEDGVGTLKRTPESFAGLRERFDVIAYDPRNSVARRNLPPSCDRPGLAAVADARNAAEYHAQAAVLAKAVDRCRADDTTGLVENMDSLSVARDMDAIRALLGEDELSLLGWSYGGVPVAAYARLYPQRVRALVLDGTPDQTIGPYAMDRVALPSIEGSFTRFVAWCASDDTCALHGQDVRKAWRRLVGDAHRNPATYTSPGLGTIRLTDLHLKFFGGAHTPWPATWPGLAAGIAKAEKGDFAWFGEQALHNSQGWAMPGFMAIRCPDALGYQGYGGFAEGRRRAERLSPDFGSGMGWEALVCSGWKQPIANPPRPLPAKGLPPALGLGSLSDFAMTDALVRNIPGSVAVRYEGPGHVMYLANDRCMTEHANRYLIELKLPPAGTVCRP